MFVKLCLRNPREPKRFFLSNSLPQFRSLSRETEKELKRRLSNAGFVFFLRWREMCHHVEEGLTQLQRLIMKMPLAAEVCCAEFNY